MKDLLFVIAAGLVVFLFLKLIVVLLIAALLFAYVAATPSKAD